MTAFFGAMMELGYDLFVYSITAVLLSFVVSKLIYLAVCSGEVGDGKESCAGGVGEGKLDKSLKVEGSTSLKKRAKKMSGETVLVSEFKGETEPAAAAADNLGGLVKADDSFDVRTELGSAEKNLEFLGTEVTEICSADQLLSTGEDGRIESSVIRKEDGCVVLDDPVENEGLSSSSEGAVDGRVVEEGCKKVGYPIEGSEHETCSRNDLDKLVVYDQRTDYREDDMVGKELGRRDFCHKEEAGLVGHGDQELVNVEQDEGRERSEPKIDDTIDVGLLGGKIIVDDQHEHHKILESLETLSEVGTYDGYAVDQVDDQNEKLRSSLYKEDVVNRDEQGRIGDEGSERSQPDIDNIFDLVFLGGENVAGHQHKHHRILESLENQREDSTQGGYVDQVDNRDGETRSSESKEDVVNRGEERRIGDEMEISDGEEWEGIERNELERDFAKAVNFVECVNKEGQLNTLGIDVLMQFYGLQKVSMEGPCHESPPMALKLSARAKWNAWQNLGGMVPEEAMEKYVNLLNEKVPGWMGKHPSVEESKLSSEEDRGCSSADANLSTTQTLPLTCINEG